MHPIRKKKHHSFILYILLASFFLGIITGTSVANAQSGGDISDQEAGKHLELARTYESAGEWKMALEEYKIASQANSESIADEAMIGMKRIILQQHSYTYIVKKDISDFLIWLIESALIFLISAAIIWTIIKIILYVSNWQSSWVIMPFLDLTRNNIGEAEAENIAMIIHEARLLHIYASSGVLAAFEEIDIPGFRAPIHQETLLSSLSAMESLDVSGIGLPVGSMLADFFRWIDMNRTHILGTIQQKGNEICISAQLRRGKSVGSSFIWTACAPISQNSLESSLSEIEGNIAFQIMYELQKDWEASTPTSLRFFTEGLHQLQLFQQNPVMQKEILEKATQLLEKAVSADPIYTIAQYTLAIAYHSLGRYQESVTILKELQMRPGHGLDLEISYNLGAAYYQYLKPWAYDYAKKEFETVVKSLSDPNLTFTQQTRELRALAHCGLISVYAQKMHLDLQNIQQFFHLAESNYYKVLAIIPHDSLIMAIAHTAFGMALLNRKYSKPDKDRREIIEDAIMQFEKAIQIKPNYWQAYIHWGRAAMAMKDMAEAVSCFRQTIALNPDYQFAHYLLGIALKRSGKFDEASTEFSHASEIPQAHDELGTILAEQKQQYEKALAEFEQALEMNPKLSNTMTNIAWYTLEGGYNDIDHLNRAFHCAQRALELDRENDNAWHRHSILGRVYLAKRQLDDAKKEFEIAIRMRPEEPQNYFFLAHVFALQQDWEKVRKYMSLFLNYPKKSHWYKKAKPIAHTLIKDANHQLCNK